MMRTTLAVFLALVAVFGVVSVAAAGSLAPADRPEQVSTVGSADVGASTPNGSNASMGAEVSAFMQASASDANASVDEGMFAAEWNQSNASAESLVTARANALENRLESLQAQKERLLAKKGQLSEVAYTARMSAIAARIGALQDAINATSTRATAAGVNATKLDALRNDAKNLTGPEVAAIARNLSVGVGGPPEGVPGKGPGGPPGDAGPTGANNSTPGNGPGAGTGTNGSANGTPSVDGPGNGSNASAAPGNGSTPGNGTDDGPGNGTDDGPGSGNGGGAGNGNGGSTAVSGTTDVARSTPVVDARIASRR